MKKLRIWFLFLLFENLKTYFYFRSFGILNSRTAEENASSACNTLLTLAKADLASNQAGNTNQYLSETIVDSIQYFSLKYCASDSRTVVMMLTSDDEADQITSDNIAGDDPSEEFSCLEVMNLLHFLHTEQRNIPEELYR